MDYKTVTADRSTFGYKILGILKNVALSYIITVILLLVFAFLLTYTDISADIVSPTVFLITVLSIMLSGILNGRNTSEKGWLSGILSGLLYMIILYVLGIIIFSDISLNTNGILMLICGMLFGAIGGIIGINNKRKVRR